MSTTRFPSSSWGLHYNYYVPSLGHPCAIIMYPHSRSSMNLCTAGFPCDLGFRSVRYPRMLGPRFIPKSPIECTMSLKSPSQPLSFHDAIFGAESEPDTVPSGEATAVNQVNQDPCPMDCSLRWVRPEISKINNIYAGNSLAVQWLGLCASTAEGTASIPSWGTNTPQAVRPKIKASGLCGRR